MAVYGGTATEVSNVLDASLHVIVSCTDRKTAKVPDALYLRNYRSTDQRAMCERWMHAIKTHRADPRPARDVYSGDHWKQVRELVGCARRFGHRVELWVLSAGYGLLHETDMIHPYSATFAPNQVAEAFPHALDKGDQAIRDSVVPESLSSDRGLALGAWWGYLNAWADEQATGRVSASLSALLGDARSRKSNVLVVASPWYLEAVAGDLGRGVAGLRRPDQQVSILSIGGRTLAKKRGFTGLLDRYFLDFDARIWREVGGAKNALNARVGQKLVEQLGVRACSRPNMERELRKMMRGLPPLDVVQRTRMTDEQVLAWIRQHIRLSMGAQGNQPKQAAFGVFSDMAFPTKSQLLKRLRTEGKACEQKRFGRLYTVVMATVDSRDI